MRRKIAVLMIFYAGAALARNPGDPLKPGFNLYSRQQDIEIGKQAASEVRQRYQQVQDPQLRAYITRIGERLAKTPTASASGFPFSFTLLNYKEVNAFALPGGPTFVFTGLLKTSDSEAEVAGVLAHEISHVILRHGTHRMSKANVIEGPAKVIALLNSLTLIGRLANIGLGLTLDGVFLKNSREDESEADALGTHIMAEAGYDPVAMARFFEKLEQQGGPGVPEFLSDHPSPGNRVEAVEAEARTLPHQTYTADNAAFERAKITIAKLPPPPDFRRANISIADASVSGYKKLETPQLSLEYPSTWAVHGDSDANLLAIAPEDGIVMGTNGEPALALGTVVSYFFSDPDRSSLNAATSDLIVRLRTEDPGIQDAAPQKSVEIDGKPALLSSFSSESPYGGTEKDLLITVVRPDGLFYLIFISPEKNWSETQAGFDHMAHSIRFSKP